MNLSFKTRKGRVCRVSIDTDRMQDYELADNPVTLEELDDDDFFCPVRTWSGYIHMVNVDPGVPVAFGKSRKSVDIYLNNVKVWTGWTKMENYTGELAAKMDYDLPIECCLSAGKYINVVEEAGTKTLSELLTEALDACIGEGLYTLHLDDSFPVAEYVSKTLWYSEWNDTEEHREGVKTYFEMMEDLMRAYGLTMYVRGEDVYCVKRYKTYDNPISFVNVQMIGSGNQWNINAPKNKVTVKGGGPVPDTPAFKLGSIELSGSAAGSSCDGGDKWVTSNPRKDPAEVTTYRLNSAVYATNLPRKYFLDKVFVGGASFAQESERSKDSNAPDNNDGENCIIISRTKSNVKGSIVASTITEPLMVWKPSLPINDDLGWMEIKGSVSGMSEYYKWDHDCAGYLMCVIKVGNYYLKNNSDGSTYWTQQQSYIPIPVGSESGLSAHAGVVGMIGASERGFVFNCLMKGQMEVWIIGFSPKNTDIVFCKLTNLSVAVREYDNVKEISHTYVANSDAKDTYEATMNLLRSRSQGICCGLNYTSRMEQTVRMWQSHFANAEVQAKVRVDDSVPHGVDNAFTWYGTLCVNSIEMDLKEDEVVMNLMSV